MARSAAAWTTRSLTVGEVEGDCAVLASDEMHVVRLPLALLPPGVAVGQIIDMSTARSVPAEHARARQIRSVQSELHARLGPAMPAAGVELSAHDVLSS